MQDASFILSEAQIHQLRSAWFGSPESRKRCYILMVRKDLRSKDRVLALCDLIRNVLSHTFQTRSTLADVNLYVERVQEFLGRDSHYPEKSKAAGGISWQVPCFGLGASAILPRPPD